MDISIPEQFAAQAEVYADAFAAGAAAERMRIATIMDSVEALSRQQTARSLALKTDMDVSAALAFLNGLPSEGSAATSFEQRAAWHSANGFGADNFAPQPGADFSAQGIKDKARAGWEKAVAKANARQE